MFSYPAPGMEVMMAILFSDDANYPNNAVFFNDKSELFIVRRCLRGYLEKINGFLKVI